MALKVKLTLERGMKLYAMMFVAAHVAALRASRRLCSPRRAVTLGRQRVGASDEERRAREAQAPLIAEQWEYGEEPFDDKTGEDDVGFALVSASASAAQVAAGVRALAPYDVDVVKDTLEARVERARA
ncbi:hypothetical protein SO694_00031132 [Aureococcus anophagefferens]|uniref:Uncharacterized protein n=1 Tax=Aureococcus anophagefferens TaxID=44056 RepID=A0ABR1FJI4_AURAN